MTEGTVFNLMTARRVQSEGGMQEPYEYTDVTGAQQVVAHIRVLFASVSTGASIELLTGNYRRRDCMKSVASQAITSVDDTTVIPLVLGRNGTAQLGAWLAVSWEAGEGDLMVVEIKATMR